MILFNDVIHILAGPALALARQELFALEVTDGANVGGILVNVDYPWGNNMRPAQDFAEKTLSRSSAAGLIQEEIKRLTGRIDGSVQIHPLAPDFDVGFVNSPGIVSLLQVWAATFIDFRCIALDPAVDSGVIQGQTPFRHHFLQISIAERIS